jgi:hypothetical protein
MFTHLTPLPLAAALEQRDDELSKIVGGDGKQPPAQSTREPVTFEYGALQVSYSSRSYG